MWAHCSICLCKVQSLNACWCFNITCAYPAAPHPAAAAAVGQQGCEVDITSPAARTAEAATLQLRHQVAAAPPLQRCQTCP